MLFFNAQSDIGNIEKVGSKKWVNQEVFEKVKVTTKCTFFRQVLDNADLIMSIRVSVFLKIYYEGNKSWAKGVNWFLHFSLNKFYLFVYLFNTFIYFFWVSEKSKGFF